MTIQQIDLSSLENLWKAFDVKILLSSTKTRGRLEATTKELARIGLDRDMYLTFINPPSAFLDHYWKTLSAHKRINTWMRENESAFLVSINHYNAISHAFNSGASSVLIFEDDACFLKDTSQISASISAIPKDYEIVLFDHNLSKQTEDATAYFSRVREARSSAIQFIPFPCNLRAATFYALSRTGMATILHNMDILRQKCIYHNDRYFNKCYWTYKDGSCHAYIATTPFAFQRPFQHIATNTCKSDLCLYGAHRIKLGIPLSSYAEVSPDYEQSCSVLARTLAY